MLSLVAAFGIACVAYGVVALTFDPVAGVVPALFAFGIALFLLLRRATRGVQAALEPLEGMLRAGRIDEADALLGAVRRRWGPWMPLLDGQLSAQQGMLDYVRMKWDDALPKLEKGRWRNWMALGCIGCIHHRKGDKDAAYASLEAATRAGRKEPLAWILRAVVLQRDGRRDEALRVLSEALEALPENKQLVDLQKRIANKKRIDTARFGQGWYQFFPDELARRMRAGAAPRGANFGPGFRGPKVTRKMRRGR